MSVYDGLASTLRQSGVAVGSIDGKRLFLVIIEGEDAGLLVALERGGCYLHKDFSSKVQSFALLAAGFDILTAPAVARMVGEVAMRLMQEPGRLAMIAHEGDNGNE